jgi:hypothetical protein
MKKFDLFSTNFINAIKDYRYLLDNKYPQKGSLKLVGDRYKLIADARTILYRGISSAGDSASREKKLINNVKNKSLIIDAYNVLFVLINYTLGKYVFISSDNICRDAGSQFGKIQSSTLIEDSMDYLFDFIERVSPSGIIMFFDAPVSHSAKHKEMAKEKLKEKGLQGECFVVASADKEIMKTPQGVVATSDTVIIDSVDHKIIDLPRLILESKYSPPKLNLKGLLERAEEV